MATTVTSSKMKVNTSEVGGANRHDDDEELNRQHITPCISPSEALLSLNAQQHELPKVLLDGNFIDINEGMPLPLTERAKMSLDEAIHNDTLFLQILEIVDYSLILGIDEER